MSNKTKVYLAGKVTGLNYAEATHKFGQQEVLLMRQGLEVVNPLNIVDSNDAWPVAMSKCIKALVDCSKVYFMPCWKDSKGARIEHDLASGLGIEIVYL